jgi:hypothetical protein
MPLSAPRRRLDHHSRRHPARPPQSLLAVAGGRAAAEQWQYIAANSELAQKMCTLGWTADPGGVWHHWPAAELGV